MNLRNLKWSLAMAVATALPVQAVMAYSDTPNDARAEAAARHDSAEVMSHSDAAKHEADNSARNKRDRNDATTLPTDQPNNQADIDTAAAVRAAIVEDDSLSMAAHNIKLIAAGGQVILRGPVDSADEKTKIGQIAGRVKGVSSVENLLDVDAD